MHLSIRLLITTTLFLRGPASAACIGPPVNSATLSLLKSFESFEPSVYDDGYGNPTIGYGHLCPDWSCADISFSQPLSEESASQLLWGDLVAYQDALINALADSVALNYSQYGALVSWTYNVGVGAMESSTLVSRLNDGGNVWLVANSELPQWIYADGEVSDGLVDRRKAEVKLFNTKSDVAALPVVC
ncbi:lysozyme-like domain-containing protein [Aspergillus pseudoustus]|uniref:Lysozyme-like domain-containing protein n=1 Tax=Aspergillus pseudoustus TaxID=1810923 RepID=A0ABR4IVF7_9EURO